MTIRGRQQYLWRAVDQDGDLIDVLVQSRRNCQAAARFFRKLLKGQGREPRRLITDKLRSYSAAHAERFLSVQGLVLNLFRMGRHLLRAVHHRLLRTRSFRVWNEVTCAC